MYIGFTYDTRETYGIAADDWRYADFSSNREVADLHKALQRLGHEVELIGNHTALLAKLGSGQRFDLVFNMAEGLASRNREGLVPAILEACGIPYVGTDAYGLSLSLNKAHTKLLAAHRGIPTPAFVEITELGMAEAALVQLNFPVIVKPCCEGTSAGLSIAAHKGEAVRCVDRLLAAYGSPVLCEEYIGGRELAVPLLGSGPSSVVFGIVEYLTAHMEPLPLFTRDLKLHEGYTVTVPELAGGLRETIEDFALNIYRYVGARDFGRADFRLSAAGVPYFLEINLLPSMEMGGAFSLCGQQAGLEYHDIIARIIQSALEDPVRSITPGRLGIC